MVGCPPGHALVSSFTASGSGRNAFAQEAQRCVQCATDQYILDPNSSLVSCQPCPIGATCDGITLHAKVQGSVWMAMNTTGQYVLASCPPGYELLNSVGGIFSYTVQQCSLCPPSFYCSGASVGKLSCPGGSFSPAGSSAIGACTPAVLVSAVISLPISAPEFDTGLQIGFRNALAYTCGMAVDRVVITSISSASSRRAGPAPSTQV